MENSPAWEVDKVPKTPRIRIRIRLILAMSPVRRFANNFCIRILYCISGVGYTVRRHAGGGDSDTLLYEQFPVANHAYKTVFTSHN